MFDTHARRWGCCATVQMAMQLGRVFVVDWGSAPFRVGFSGPLRHPFKRLDPQNAAALAAGREDVEERAFAVRDGTLPTHGPTRPLLPQRWSTGTWTSCRAKCRSLATRSR